MSSDEVIEVPGPDGVRQVRLSSPDRVMWPDLGITKGDLAAYVVAVGEPLLGALADRPVTLQRFPEGIEGEEFYSKNPPRGHARVGADDDRAATRRGADTTSSSSTRSRPRCGPSR